jgi:LacI family transcriptional regulator
MDTNHLPAHLEPVWRRFPSVVTGVRTRDPALSFCCVDHFDLALTAFERAVGLGYKKPGLVLDSVIDALVERRFSAGYHTAQRKLPRSQRIPVFGDVAGAARSGKFRHWLDTHRPDVVFTLYNSVIGWLKAAGRKIPEDVGVIQLEWRASRPEVAGMNQHNSVTGEAAVDMVVSQIHNNETGIQEFPRSTMIGATWVDGATVKDRGEPGPRPGAHSRKRA